jgi:hypothetical protein
MKLSSRDDIAGRKKNHAGSVAIASLYILSIARIATEFVDQSYNWDVDTFIYHGQQLLRGEPVWMSEYMGALVVRDLLFAIPSAFGPLLTWRLISLGSAVLALICVVALLPDVMKKTGYPEREARRAAILSGGLYLLVSGHLPGGFTHINVLPSSMAIMALLFGLALLGERRNRLEVFALTASAGFAAAVSISVRPYFIFPLAMSFIVVGFLIFAEKRLSDLQKTGRILGLLLTPAVIGFGLNLLPYFIVGNVGQFFSQLTFLVQMPPSGKNSIIDVFVNVNYGIHPGIRLWLVGMLLWSVVEIGIAFRSSSNGMLSALIPLSSILIAVGILIVYFWDHYPHFFSWYFSIMLATRLILFDRKVSAEAWGRLKALVEPSFVVPISVSILAALVLVFGVGPTATAPSIARVNSEHPDLALAQALESRFSNVLPSRPAFFVPQNPYVHWKLEESRHGFPDAHQANKILGGAWENLPTLSYTFKTPRNVDEYCGEILESSIEVVVLEASSALQPCFTEAGPRWSYEPVLDSGDEDWGLWWRQ